MKRVQKNNQNGEKIEVLAVSNQKLQISGTSKRRRHSGRGGDRKINLTLFFKSFVRRNFLTENVNYLIVFSGGIKNDATSSPR